jgi:OmpA-OmpF porin, OOP family
MRPIFGLILLVLPGFTFAQAPAAARIVKNLVPNGSFENYRKPSLDVRKATPWGQIESVDFYQKPLSNDTTPDRGAYAGSCYTGFRFRKKYKEFLQVRLAEPLHRDNIYEFSMHLRLAFWSNVVVRSFGAVFSKGGYRGQQDAQRSYMVDSVFERGIHNNYRWVEIRGFYKAAGGEKYVTIGNFSPLIKRDMISLNLFRLRPREAYYFVDDIRLVRAEQFDDKVAVQRIGPDYMEAWLDSTLKVKPDIKVGETVALQNIQFENGRYYLLPESYHELNKLASYLIRHPTIEIRINGHSDNSGLKFRNQKMSELRAREVFEYLIRKGVQNKMTFKGYGSAMPVADNDTDAGRARNRRVEFEIIKK